MSESEAVEVKASDLEALKPLVDFLSRNIYDSFEATKGITADILHKISTNEKISEQEKRTLYLTLGAVSSLNFLLREIYSEGLSYNFFALGENVREYLRVMSDVAEALLYLDKVSNSAENVITATWAYDKLRNAEYGLMSLIKAIIKHAHGG
jgi:hypothetical protein